VLPDEIRGYRIQTLLGAGAMGAVYRAVASGGRRGLKAGDEVALKVLDPRYAPDAGIVKRFKREAGVGLGAGHSGIARVYEIGSLRLARGGDGKRVHYIVQELLKGGSLQSRLELEGRQPEPVIREVGRQVAETLAFVHGRRIVHRDLKPANLFLDERGQVKVVDFGLARLVTEEDALASEREAADFAASFPPPSTGATTVGKFLGTVAYAAPEQLDGAAATPQSDLFSLGLVLHEMATGTHPFARERDQGYDAYVAAATSRDALPLVDARPELSWFLSTIVALLLERDPEARVADAAQVADAFARGERSDLFLSAIAAGGATLSPARRRLGVRRATRLLGRAGELAQLADEARGAFAGGGRRVLLEGESGSGKTRLVDALAERLDRSGPRAAFLVVRPPAAPAAPPEILGPFRELLQDALGDEPRSDVIERFLQDGAARLAAPELASLRAALVELLRAIARPTPLLLVLDGAERADVETLRVVEALAPEKERRSILLLITLAAELPFRKEAAPFLENLRRGATRIALGPLEAAAFPTLALDLGVDDLLAEKAGRRLHELSVGNPGTAVDLAAWLLEKGGVAALVGRRVTVASLPPAIVERLDRATAPLEPLERALLEVAAVLGAELRLPILRELLGVEDAATDALLRRLEQERRVLRRRGEQVRFREPLLRRRLLTVTPAEKRRAIHLLAARHYERELAGASPPPRTAVKAAIHAGLAHERAILAATLRRAVRVLELEGALGRAWRLVTRAEESARRAPLDPKLLGEALVLRGPLAHRLGRREEERAIWSEAAKLAAQLGEPALRALSFHGLGRLASRTGRFLEAETLLHDADLAAEKAPPGSGVERSMILLDLAEALLWSGDEERCAQALERAERAIDAGAAIGSIGRYFKERGNLLLELERFDEAREAYSQGRAVVRGPALRPLHRAMVLGTARLLREVADFGKARRACEIARHSAEADQDLRHLAQAWYVLGDVESRAGNPDAAFVPYVRALRLAHRIEDDYMRVSALGSLSFLYRWKRFSKHSLPKAIRCARRATARAHKLAVGRLEARGLAALALCYRDLGKPSWALAIARKAVREASAAGVRRRRAAEIYWVHGLILGEAGEREAANLALDEARRRIERRLLGVASPAVRSRMMSQDPLLREIEATRF
jgi:tetratricopeptide (TPR) repeat protein